VPRVVVTTAERPDLADRVDFNVWPEYNTKGDVLNRYWRRLYDVFPEFQFVLYDEDEDVVVAEGHTIPFAWDGTVDGLPAGIDGLVEDAFRLREEGGAPTALSALAIEIRPAVQGGGLSRSMIEAMAQMARERGLSDLVAPLRPSWKERYPLAPIQRYAQWKRADGLPFDPWIRTHVRLGGELLKPEAQSMRISGTVAEWEEWTEMAFPDSGEYVFPHGLAPLALDRERDVGLYFEPNVWVAHRVE
jgi:GNAT superfamily N-acetyltransferase